MYSTIPARKLVAKAVAVGVIGGTLALGTGGTAFATTTTSTTTGTTHCARAPKALAKIDKAEAAITKRLPKLQSAEKRLSTAHHAKLAAAVEKRITKLQKAEAKATALAAKIEAKCPSGSTS